MSPCCADIPHSSVAENLTIIALVLSSERVRLCSEWHARKTRPLRVFSKTLRASVTRVVHLGGQRNFMQDLKDQLASLRIDREAPRRGRWRWLFLVVVLAIAAVGAFYFARAR